ncbi:hypothetical protein PZA11_005851 [Diplocarpon coronariae]|uniref:Uncharacterized protein n=1 Tax=Diplocarpon coronariae TaxID=2795749 RepID=A0A218YV72_9HELO|nr:hypothetical protein B2J93_7110 [Marssonina coronariae]
MKGLAVDQLVYEVMFPKPKSTDPQNFQGLLQRQLVPEVRLETQAFYGHLSSQEAKYPGLDYSYQPHRVRLSRYPWHRRLFRAFDNLGLTKSEIACLTKWEGTRWAKERFEREQGILIRDTTADGIHDWAPPELRLPVAQQARSADIEEMEEVQDDEETEDNEAENEMDEEADDSEVELQSVGVDLNERLRAAAAQRDAGEDTVMDEEWEQWLKETVEAGGIPFLPTDLSPNANIPGTRPAIDCPQIPPRILNAARLGHWGEIPDYLHNLVRQEIQASNRTLDVHAQIASTPGSPAPSGSTGSPFATAARAIPAASLLGSNARSYSRSQNSGRPDASPHLTGRPSLGPHPRAVTNTTSGGRAEARTPARLQSRFSDQVSRRPLTNTFDAGSTHVSVSYRRGDNQPSGHS